MLHLYQTQDLVWSQLDNPGCLSNALVSTLRLCPLWRVSATAGCGGFGTLEPSYLCLNLGSSCY